MTYYLLSKYGGVVRVRILLWGLCVFTNQPRDEWNEAARIALFDRPSYPFLKRHLFGNLWWANLRVIRETWEERAGYADWQYVSSADGRPRIHGRAWAQIDLVTGEIVWSEKTLVVHTRKKK